MKITVKKPIWSTQVVDIFGDVVIIHNYADGTNSGPLDIYGGCHPSFGHYKRAVRFDGDDPIAKLLEALDEV